MIFRRRAGSTLSNTTLTPYLTVSDGDAAVIFYSKAFEAVEIGPRLVHRSGKILHTELAVGNARFMLADEFPEWGNQSPAAFGGTPVRINLETDDIDSLAERAVDAGAEILIPVSDQFYGYRSGRLADPFGHIWILSQKVEDVSQEDMQQRADELFKEE